MKHFECRERSYEPNNRRWRGLFERPREIFDAVVSDMKRKAAVSV